MSGCLLNPAFRPDSGIGLLEKRRRTRGSPAAEIVLLQLYRLLDLVEDAPTRSAALERVESQPDTYILGSIDLETYAEIKTCGDVWVVAGSYAQRGWGPLLYDSALDFVKHTGAAGLMPDRQLISESAERLWKHYAKERPDVASRRVGVEEGFRCPLYMVQWLDSIYWPSGGFSHGEIAGMRKRFQRTLTEIGEYGISRAEMQSAILKGAANFYEEAMGAGGRMRHPISATRRPARRGALL